MAEMPKFGLKDCSRRLIYKLSSQKVVSFVYASGAIYIVCKIAVGAKVFTAAVAEAAITAIRDIAIALLVMRGTMNIATVFKKQGSQPASGESGSGDVVVKED